MTSYLGRLAADEPEDVDSVAIVSAALLLRKFSSEIVNDRHVRIMIPAPTPAEAPSLPPQPVTEEQAEPASRAASTSQAAPSRSASKTPSDSSHSDFIRHHTCDCPLDSAICHNAAAIREIFFSAVKDEQERVLRLFTLACVQDARIRSLFWAREHGNSGKTALQLAASKGMPDSVETIVEVLTGEHDKIDAADESGMTSFMMAARTGCLEAVQVLDSFGAQRSLRSIMGKRAADYAEESGHHAVVAYFSRPKPSGKPMTDFRTQMSKLQRMSDKLLNKISRRAFEIWCDTAGGHLRREADLQNLTDEAAREELTAQYKREDLNRFGPKWEEDLRERENAIRRKLCAYILDRAAENPDLMFVRLVTSAKQLLKHLDREERERREREAVREQAKKKSKNLWRGLTKDVKEGSLTLQAVKAGHVKRPRMRNEVPMVPPATKLIHNKMAHLNGTDPDASPPIDTTWLAGDGSGRLQYVQTCSRRGARPDPAILQQLASSKLALNDFALVRRRDGAHEEVLPEAEAVLLALRNNCLLRSLSVSSPGTKEGGGEALVDAVMQQDSCLFTFKMHIGALTPTAAGTVRRFLVDPHCILTRLDLTDTLVGNTGAMVIAQGVEANTSLSELFLRRCSIGAPGCTALADALRVNDTLTELDLAWNACGSGGATSLFATIETAATALQSLDVSWNRIGLPGAEALGRALAANSTLRNLDVSHCAVPAAGCEVLADGLAHNTTLATLKLDANPLGEKGRELVARSLQHRAIRVSLNTGSSRPENELLTASNQPLHDLKANASGHYELDLDMPSHRAIASFLVGQGCVKGADTWRNESLDGQPFEFHPAWEVPEEGRLTLDFLEPARQDGEVMSEINFERFCSIMHRIPSAGGRLMQIRKVSEDFIFSSTQAMMLLGGMTEGVEREIAILLLSSRIRDTKAIPNIINILGRASRNSVIIKAGPAVFFDERYPAGRYYLRLNRRGDRHVLFRLFYLAKTKPRRSIDFLTIGDGPLPIAELMAKPIRVELAEAPQLPLLEGTSYKGKEVMKYRWADNTDRLEQWAKAETLDGEVNLHRIAYVKEEESIKAETEIVQECRRLDREEKLDDPHFTAAKRRMMEWLECVLPDGWAQEYEEEQRAAQLEREALAASPIAAFSPTGSSQRRSSPGVPHTPASNRRAGTAGSPRVMRGSSPASIQPIPRTASTLSAKKEIAPVTAQSAPLAVTSSSEGLGAVEKPPKAPSDDDDHDDDDDDDDESSEGSDSDDSDARSISSTEQEMLLEAWLPASIPRDSLVPRPWTEVRIAKGKIKKVGPRALLRFAASQVLCLDFSSPESGVTKTLAKAARRGQDLRSAQVSAMVDTGERATFLWLLVEREEGNPATREWERRLFMVTKTESGDAGLCFLDRGGARVALFLLDQIDSSQVLTERDDDYVKHPVCPFTFVVTVVPPPKKEEDKKKQSEHTFEPSLRNHIFAAETRNDCNRWIKLLAPAVGDGKKASAIEQAEKMFQRIMGTDNQSTEQQEGDAEEAEEGDGDGGDEEDAEGGGTGQDFFRQWLEVSERIDKSLQQCLDCAPPSRRRNIAVLLRENKYSKKHARAALLIQARFRGIRDRTEAKNKQHLKFFLDSVEREQQLRKLGGYDPVKSKWVTFTPISASAPKRPHWVPPASDASGAGPTDSDKLNARARTAHAAAVRPVPPPQPASPARATTTHGTPRTRFFTADSSQLPEPVFGRHSARFSAVHQLVPTSGLGPREHTSRRANRALLDDTGGGSPLSGVTPGQSRPHTTDTTKSAASTGGVSAAVVSDKGGKEAEAVAKQKREEREQRLMQDVLRLKIRDLHRELRARNLPTTGMKFELIRRLQEHHRQQQLQRKQQEEHAAAVQAAHALAGRQAREPSRTRSRDASGEGATGKRGEKSPMGPVRSQSKASLHPKTRASMPDVLADAKGSESPANARARTRLLSVEGSLLGAAGPGLPTGLGSLRGGGAGQGEEIGARRSIAPPPSS